MARRRDPMDSVIESALQPGRVIRWSQWESFLTALREAEHKISALAASSPSRALSLYETFIAACNQKAEEIDDSDGDFARFAGGLCCGWIQARKAVGAAPGETVEILLSWIENDDYGFCNSLGVDAAKLLDCAGLAALEHAVQIRFELERGNLEERLDNYSRNGWGEVLRSIYVRQGSIEKYLELTARTGLTPADCAAIAIMLQEKGKPTDALAWLDRGREIESTGSSGKCASCNLGEMRRALLAKLGREREALDSAWIEFEAYRNKFTYEQLLRYVPKSERMSWHAKAMAASEQGRLAELIELWLGENEIERLVQRLNGVSDSELEGLSHYATEPAAKELAKTHPAVAAKLFRAMCMRILNAGKSSYYYAAIENLEEARRLYLAAGLDEAWRELMAEIRRDHRRKHGFMPRFEAIVAGKRARI